MTEFPLAPRQSRIIVEAILRYPDVAQETLNAAAFLSTQSPYILPPGEETDARRAHHSFRDPHGDFVSYLKLFRAYNAAPRKDRFCEKNYLDERAMAEIVNVVSQLEEILAAQNIPILSGGKIEDYLCCVSRGLIQFVCVREGRETYRSLTADRIMIHPGSVMFRLDPQYIVAGEIVRTTRMYAMSVSPLSRETLEKISPDLFASFGGKARKGESPGPAEKLKKARDFTHNIKISGEVFEIQTIKGKKTVILPWERLRQIRDKLPGETVYRGLKGMVLLEDRYTLLAGEKLELILALVPALDIDEALSRSWPRKQNFNSRENLPALLEELPKLVCPAVWKGSGGGGTAGAPETKASPDKGRRDKDREKKDLGFICLFTDSEVNYWFKCSRGFHTALNESLAALETLIDEL